jgi:hypothetical protein
MPPVTTPGESARQQAERRRVRIEQLERRAKNWDGGAAGEELTAESIEKRCPKAIALHDRRMPDSRANIDHIVVVPSGVWVIDSKRMKGRIKVEDADDGTQRLVVNGNDQGTTRRRSSTSSHGRSMRFEKRSTPSTRGYR